MTAKCAVPGCLRAWKAGGDVAWWFCGEHARMCPPELRLLRRKLSKRYRDRGELQDRKGYRICMTDRCWRAFCGLNRRIRKAVFERAAGIS